MEIDEIIENIAEKTGKSEAYLKGIFTKERKILIEQFGDAIEDDKIDMLAVIKLGKKYDITKSDIDGFGSKDEDASIYEEKYDIDEILEDLDVLDDEEDVIEKIKNGIENGKKINDSDWGRFMKTIPDPVAIVTTNYERTPSIIIEIGPTYYLKLTYPKNPIPYSHEFDGKYGAYMKHAYKVTLVKVSDEDLYDVKYKEGEFKGKKAFINGQNYTLWLDDKAAGFFGIFWTKHTDDGLPDGRTFTFKKGFVKGRNVFTFRLPKK